MVSFSSRMKSSNSLGSANALSGSAHTEAPSIIGGSMSQASQNSPTASPGPMLSWAMYAAQPISAAWGHTTSFAAAVVPDVSTQKAPSLSSFVYEPGPSSGTSGPSSTAAASKRTTLPWKASGTRDTVLPTAKTTSGWIIPNNLRTSGAAEPAGTSAKR